MTINRFSPWGLAQSGTEHGEQAAFFAWCNRVMWVGPVMSMTPELWDHPTTQALMRKNVDNDTPIVPALRWIHAIPNGGERSAAVAGNMKAEGVKSGVADIFLPCSKVWSAMQNEPNNYIHGWYCELKRKNGKPSDLSANQKLFREHALSEGYAWCWARGWEDARDKLIAYASGAWTEKMEEIQWIVVIKQH